MKKILLSLFLTSAIFIHLSLGGLYEQNCSLPAPVKLLKISHEEDLPLLRGLRFDPDDPLKIEFIVDLGSKTAISTKTARRIVSYFLAGLAVPDDQLWVNLSPYEENRIIPEQLGETDLGRDMLGQDYILKQLSSSLTHPDTPTGRAYWGIKNRELKIENGSTQISTERSALSKVWITPETAEVYIKDNSAIITKAQLGIESESSDNDPLLPAVNADVNRGANFAPLRQVYHSLILARWFKEKYINSLYAAYIDQNNTNGIETQNRETKEKVFVLYKKSFEQGVYDLLRKKSDPISNTSKKSVKRFFSGGCGFQVIPLSDTPSDTDIPETFSGSALTMLIENIPLSSAPLEAVFVRDTREKADNTPGIAADKSNADTTIIGPSDIKHDINNLIFGPYGFIHMLVDRPIGLDKRDIKIIKDLREKYSRLIESQRSAKHGDNSIAAGITARYYAATTLCLLIESTYILNDIKNHYQENLTAAEKIEKAIKVTRSCANQIPVHLITIQGLQIQQNANGLSLDSYRLYIIDAIDTAVELGSRSINNLSDRLLAEKTAEKFAALKKTKTNLTKKISTIQSADRLVKIYDQTFEALDLITEIIQRLSGTVSNFRDARPLQQIINHAGVLKNNIAEFRSSMLKLNCKGDIQTDTENGDLSVHTEKTAKDLSIRADDIKWHINIEPGIECAFSKTGISLLLSNTVMNAVRAVHNANHNSQGYINISLYRDSENIILKINDNGEGIPEDKLNWVFTEGNSLNRDSGGTGKGLSTVLNIVRAMNGTIELNSTTAEESFWVHGTSFTFRFPVNQTSGNNNNNILTVRSDHTAAEMDNPYISSDQYDEYTDQQAAGSSLTNDKFGGIKMRSGELKITETGQTDTASNTRGTHAIVPFKSMSFKILNISEFDKQELSED